LNYLLDANVLVALFWPAHSQHKPSIDWFGNNRSQGWVTCPFTEASFVRVISNPAFSRDAVAPQEAIAILNHNTEGTDHVFWPDDLSLVEVGRFCEGRLAGHQQVSDAYLLSLAIHHDGVLVTFDRSISALLPSSSNSRRHLKVLEG
jgi:toxin-antitoxin system PIN domain toxin